MTSPENLNQDQFKDHDEYFDFYHVSGKHNRQSIESNGLKADYVTNGEDESSPDFYEKGPGVWVSSLPQADYGDDVYGIRNPKTGKKVPGYAGTRRDEGVHDTEGDSEGHEFIPHDVPISDFKRVGHVYHNPSGHTEIHWHKEEDCPNGR